MGSRKINREYLEYDNNKNTAICIAERMVVLIDYYLENENLLEDDAEFLKNSKMTIIDIIKKSKKARETPIFQPSSLPLEEYCRYLMDLEEKEKDEFIKDMQIVFDLEDEIYKRITLPVWKKYFSNGNTTFKQGEEFHYIVHAGCEIINLPGRIGYKKNRNFKGDYISASILSDQDISTFENLNVGLILEANDAIISAVSIDAGTTINGMQTVRTVYDFENGIYVHSGGLGYMTDEKRNYREIATKIAHPAIIEQETAWNNREVKYGYAGGINEVVLDDGKVNVVGIFFKTNGREINLRDFIHVKKLEALYRVPVRIINTSLYRKQKGQEMFSEKDNEVFSRQLMKFSHPENLAFVREHPAWTRKLISHYFTEVVEGAEFDEETRQKIDKKDKKTHFFQRPRKEKWLTVESDDKTILKYEKYEYDGRIASIILRSKDGKYSVEPYLNGRPSVVVEYDEINDTNSELIYDYSKKGLEEYIDKIKDEKEYGDFLR